MNGLNITSKDMSLLELHKRNIKSIGHFDEEQMSNLICLILYGLRPTIYVYVHGYGEQEQIIHGVGPIGLLDFMSDGFKIINNECYDSVELGLKFSELQRPQQRRIEEFIITYHRVEGCGSEEAKKIVNLLT